jgi:hypothetical protein
MRVLIIVISAAILIGFVLLIKGHSDTVIKKDAVIAKKEAEIIRLRKDLQSLYKIKKDTLKELQ